VIVYCSLSLTYSSRGERKSSMTVYIFRRTLWMLLVLFVVSFITFVLMRLVPGGPFNTERGVPEPIIRNLERRYNLDAPLHEQYIDYIGGILIPHITGSDYRRSVEEDYLINIELPIGEEGTAFRWMNFGPSLTRRSQTVTSIIRDTLPVSVTLGIAALIVGLAIGVPSGIIAALKRNTVYDYAGMGIAILGVSIPAIVLGPLLQYFFGVQLGWFPVTGWGDFEDIILPSFALGFAQAALIARLTRASLLQVLNEDYIRTARAKGLRERRVVILHALRNALIPVVTVLGPLAAALLTGTFVVEIIFGIPGLGKFFVNSITNRDYTIIMGTVLLYASFLVIANLIVDLVYAWIDPRIQYTS
jgi:ABC-type dipeptide/oligopeptide/nickel transport system permease component